MIENSLSPIVTKNSIICAEHNTSVEFPAIPIFCMTEIKFDICVSS